MAVMLNKNQSKKKLKKIEEADKQRENGKRLVAKREAEIAKLEAEKAARQASPAEIARKAEKERKAEVEELQKFAARSGARTIYFIKFNRNP